MKGQNSPNREKTLLPLSKNGNKEKIFLSSDFSIIENLSIL